MTYFEKHIKPDFEALRRCILREGTPDRVHFIELHIDQEIKDSLISRFGLSEGLVPSDRFFHLKQEIALQRFLGYDMVRFHPPDIRFRRSVLYSPDTTEAEGQARQERTWNDEHHGMISSWDEFERYPWPEPEKVDLSDLDWLEKSLPDDMAVYGGGGQMLEQASWLLGYEPLCLMLYENPELVDAVIEKCGQIFRKYYSIITEYTCVGAIFAGDDMGFKTQTLLSPDILRGKFLPWHKKFAEVVHKNRKLYLLHSCGNVESIMDDLIESVEIDGKHSFEDAIVPVTEMKQRYGARVALLGGIDVDFISRHTEEEIRQQVRRTLDICQPGGGYCLGTGNSVANYIPIDNYLAMLDEGRRY